LDTTTTSLVHGLAKQWKEAGFNYTINHVGSMFTLFFTDKPVIDFDTAKTADTTRFAAYFQSMLQQGIYLAPSQFEAMFISAAITEDIVEEILEANRNAIRAIV
jgi:glutamate-1-semialdehyde 2,1-aminomutase